MTANPLECGTNAANTRKQINKAEAVPVLHKGIEWQQALQGGNKVGFDGCLPSLPTAHSAYIDTQLLGKMGLGVMFARLSEVIPCRFVIRTRE
ncbi:hypothetical protein [Rugosibacter aromaticivorans]|uniref:hypothetical protein n=1 Tax=Rugosibacter aromaticivorans TaxID=1565605 RepID=UPI001F2E90AF|nr:hypothetical protein [Rugosibacter aromaticivorans]